MGVKPLRVGVVGVGSMGKNHVRVLSTMPEFQLIGCFDANSDACSKVAEAYKIWAFESMEALCDEVDVVNIATPSSLHKEHALIAAEKGCHVLVEKPIALNEADAQDIIDACARGGGRLCVGHVERYNPAIATLMEILEHEEIISVDFRRLSPFAGRISDADVVQDLMIHDIDILNAISKAPIARVCSQGARVYTDMLDYAQAIVAYEDGMVASLTASRVTESKERKAQINAKNAFITVDYLNRSVEISRKTNFELNVGHPTEYKQENIVERVFVPSVEPLRSEFEHFAHCINTGEEIATSGEMGKRAVALAARVSGDAFFA